MGWCYRKARCKQTTAQRSGCRQHRRCLDDGRVPTGNHTDPFFDRDLNHFRLLFDLRAVSVGVIITRSDHLQDIFNDLGRKSSYGNSTTHMSKLLPRIEGGGAAGCPLLVFGITRKLDVP